MKYLKIHSNKKRLIDELIHMYKEELSEFISEENSLLFGKSSHQPSLFSNVKNLPPLSIPNRFKKSTATPLIVPLREQTIDNNYNNGDINDSKTQTQEGLLTFKRGKKQRTINYGKISSPPEPDAVIFEPTPTVTRQQQIDITSQGDDEIQEKSTVPFQTGLQKLVLVFVLHLVISYSN